MPAKGLFLLIPLLGLSCFAWIVARRHHSALAAELQDHVRARLGAHEFPRVVEFVDALPRTPAGKIDRHALRARGRSGVDVRAAARPTGEASQ